MTFKNEADFEEAMIALLQNKGWAAEVLKNPTEQDLIDNWAKILFENNRGQDRLNDVPLTSTEMAQILEQIETLRTPMQLNRFVNGRTVSIKRDNPNDHGHLGKEVSLNIYNRLEIAGGTSRYQIAQQPRFTSSSEILGDRRGDLMLLINGMPLIHIELKRSNVPVDRATSQIERYAGQGVFTGLFSLIQIFVAATPEETVYFANPGPEGRFNKDYFFHWADVYNVRVNQWDQVAGSLLSIPMAHQLIGFYTVADGTDGVLKVMRSYQYFAANRISDTVARADWDSGKQRGGFIWHTTGSGKTMTSFKSAQLIANSQDADKVIFLMDRIELGTQSLREYRGFSDDFDEVQATEDTQVLIKKLKSDDVNETLIVTSIQKMSNVNDEYGVRKVDLARIADKRLVFIVDEAHRSTFGEMMTSIKNTFPKAIFFGFTGTPIHEKNQKKGSDTATIFGDELHRYSIADGIRDKNVLGFDQYRVDTYKANDLRRVIALAQAKAKDESEVFGDPKREKIFDRFMDSSKVPPVGYFDEGKGKFIKGIEDYLSAAQYERAEHRESVVDDIADGWSYRSRNSKFHAILATSSIPEAIEYYRLVKKVMPDLKVTALFDPNADEGDSKIMKEAGVAEILKDYNARYGQSFTLATHAEFKKDASNRLAHKKPHERIDRNPAGQLDLIIVVNQLLTGFDSKWVNTLYLDKVLEHENIIQAFSRTNRLFGSDKQFGLIRYYRKPATMQRNIDLAVEMYSGEQLPQLFVERLGANMKRINETFAEIKKLFIRAGIPDFSRLPEEAAECMLFGKLFSQLHEYVGAARLQGFRWGQDEYTPEDADAPIRVDLDEDTYSILVVRYEDLIRADDDDDDDDGSGGPSRGVAYALDTHLTEMDVLRIDAEYLDTRFEKYTKALTAGNVSEEELRELRDDLHSQFAHLPQGVQKYANIFLHDLETGEAELESGKSLCDYLTKYQQSESDRRIRRVVECFGVAENILRQLLSTSRTEQNLNEFGRFDKLRESIDLVISRDYYIELDGELLSNYRVRQRTSQILRKYVLTGALPQGVLDGDDDGSVKEDKLIDA